MRQLKLKILVFATCIGLLFVAYSLAEYNRKSSILWERVKFHVNREFGHLPPQDRKTKAETLFRHLTDTVQIDYLLENPDEIGKYSSP